MIEIREPKFKVGDKVTTPQEGKKAVGTIEGIKLYDFPKGTYAYIVRLEKDNGFTYKQLYLDELVLDIYIEKPKTVWDLKRGDTYYFLSQYGGVESDVWNDTPRDNYTVESGNAFLTKEEAEFECERRKIETEMLRLGGRRKTKRDDDNYYIAYDDKTGNFVYPISIWDNAQGLIFFDSDIDAVKAVQEIGEDRIKKYIFGVEE